ncbi:hypothetical protein [Hyphomicrobium sp.]|jgi:hypothetical protein|uniref:hypothetical protein n=1 Tax=Hyphomicrobium sp. TaxID=82 RepID=UPI0035695733
MSAILVDPQLSEGACRDALYSGSTVMLKPQVASKKLCAFAWQMIQDAFYPLHPEQAQHELPVEKFAAIIAALKPKFTHSPESKQFLKELFEELGWDPAKTYFDVPKLRIVTHSSYLTSGMGYAYKAHRDVWYSAPPCQINWWTPINEIQERSAMVIHPRYFNREVPNNSSSFDAYKWNAEGRKNASLYVNNDPRNHPHLQENIDLDWQVLVGRPGSLMLFSAQQLHSTVPNDSGKTRFSIDFRTINEDDILAHRGARMVDASCTGTTLPDFIRSTDHARFAEDIVKTYEVGGRAEDGVLVFDPGA